MSLSHSIPIVIRLVTRRAAGPVGLLAHPFAAYAVSGLFHVMALSGLSIWAARETDPAFSMRQGDGGLGEQFSMLGSIGGAKETAVFEISWPTTSVVASGETEDEAVVEVALPAKDLEPENMEPTPTAPLLPIAVALTAPQSDEDPLPVVEVAEVMAETQEIPTAALAIERTDADEKELLPGDSIARRQLARRKLATAPQVDDEPIALPDLEANGRGASGDGSGNQAGGGNSGASGRAGGDLESIARSGPWNPAPMYPPVARAANMEGIVRIRVQIGADGNVTRAVLWRSSGWPVLDDAAMQVVPRWRFEPARRGGIPVACEVIVPIDFYFRRS